MNMFPLTVLGLLLPFAGTTLGSGTVFLLKNQMNERLQKGLLGFAAGIMIAASVWSLLLPALEMSKHLEKTSWLPASAGFLLGVGFLLWLDSLIPKLHIDVYWPEGSFQDLGKSFMLVLAVTLHNIPEGMAVGVALAGMLDGSASISPASALALSAGIAIQNFPEGAIVSAPMASNGFSRGKAFLYGTLSGAVEPIAAVLTILITSLVTPVLPYILSFAAGAMIYVVVEELIPESQIGEYTNIGTIGVAAGFTMMMILDVMLG